MKKLFLEFLLSINFKACPHYKDVSVLEVHIKNYLNLSNQNVVIYVYTRRPTGPMLLFSSLVLYQLTSIIQQSEIQRIINISKAFSKFLREFLTPVILGSIPNPAKFSPGQLPPTSHHPTFPLLSTNWTILDPL